MTASPTTGRRAVYLYNAEGVLTSIWRRQGTSQNWLRQDNMPASSRFVAKRIRQTLAASGQVAYS